MKRVLIAEDNDSNYLLMTYILKNRYEFDRARNGQEAVDMVESYAPDLIIMDLKMPVINGIEVSRRIRKNHPDLPIIILTASAFESDREEAESIGCNELLTKPVSGQKCLEIINRLI